MNTLIRKLALSIGLLFLLGQSSVFADDRSHSQRDRAENKHWQKSHNSRRVENEHRDRRYDNVPAPSYNHYYKPGYPVKPLPRGYSRVYVNAIEYFFFDGFFYRPSRQGYIVVDAPIGAIVAALPGFHHIVQWRHQPYYVVGNTYYRRHPHGYVVVPNPGFGYRR